MWCAVLRYRFNWAALQVKATAKNAKQYPFHDEGYCCTCYPTHETGHNFVLKNARVGFSRKGRYSQHALFVNIPARAGLERVADGAALRCPPVLALPPSCGRGSANTGHAFHPIRPADGTREGEGFVELVVAALLAREVPLVGRESGK